MLESGDFKSGNDFLIKLFFMYKFEFYVELFRLVGMVRYFFLVKLEIILFMEGSNSDLVVFEFFYVYNW